MNFEVSVTINAPREHVWAVLTNVERWPEWTASMTTVAYVEGNCIAVGSKARIKQPRLPAVVWEVTAVEPGQSFSWQARSAGITTLATHRLTAGPAGDVTVHLGIRQSGPLGWLIGLLMARMTRRYVGMEAEGLKHRCLASAETP